MKSYSKIKKQFINQAKEIFTDNYRSGYSKWHNHTYNYISPANMEYIYQYVWDTAFHSIVLSHFDIEWAKKELDNHLKAQWSDGFIPHVIFWGNQRRLPAWAYSESKWSDRPRTTALNQPPVLAIAVEEIYKKDKDKNFLRHILPKLAQYHRWLLKNRDLDKDFLISLISSNESGMDELPAFQRVFGYQGDNAINLHLFYRRIDVLNYVLNFNSKLILWLNYFNVEDLLFNCVFAESSRSLSRLFTALNERSEADYFKHVAKQTEQAILLDCWNDQDQIYYSLYSNNKKQTDIKTIESFMPLYLDGIPKEKADILVRKHLLNPDEFWRPYPIPTVSKDEPYYHPDPEEKRINLLWRGTVWINTNWFIVKGLRKHGYHDVADEIVEKMVEVIEREGFREFYSPETGKGYRREHFGWSSLIIDLL